MQTLGKYLFLEGGMSQLAGMSSLAMCVLRPGMEKRQPDSRQQPFSLNNIYNCFPYLLLVIVIFPSFSSNSLICWIFWWNFMLWQPFCIHTRSHESLGGGAGAPRIVQNSKGVPRFAQSPWGKILGNKKCWCCAQFYLVWCLGNNVAIIDSVFLPPFQGTCWGISLAEAIIKISFWSFNLW